MAGKYSVVLNKRKREVCASMPDNNGVDYRVDVRETAGVYDFTRKNAKGLAGFLKCTGLELTSTSIFSNVPLKDTYFFVFSKDWEILEKEEKAISISLEGGKVSLHFPPGISDKRDEAELLANASVILERVVSYVEQRKIWN